jgi:protein SCO1/2
MMDIALGPSHIRKSNFIEKLVANKLFWVVMCALLFGYPIYRSVYRTLPPELPILAKVPEFRFVDENGNSFGTRELTGKVYIANFMFTTCQTSCPTLLAKVQTVQHRLRGVIDRAAIVSFTVDPETDTSKVLYAKARELKANPSVWRFLSSSVEETKKLLIYGFKVPMGKKEIANSIMDVGHSNKFVLVDQDGNIRGYYGTDKDSINQMMIDTGLIINRKKKS